MDKKNTVIGVILLVTALSMMLTTKKPAPLPPQEAPTQTQPANASEIFTNAPTQDTSPPAPGTPASSIASSSQAHLESNDNRTGETIATIGNDFFEVRLTNYGGAIKEVVLLDTPKTLGSEEPYVMNEQRYAPALNLTTYLGNAEDIVFQAIPTNSRNSVSYTAKLSDQLEIVRTYTVSQDHDGAAPFTIAHSIEYRNLGDQPLPISESYLNIGTVAPSGKQDRFVQSFGYHDGEDVNFIEQSDFTGGGLPFFKKEPKDIDSGSANIVWASLKNQFFITLLTPKQPGIGYIARKVDFPANKLGEEPPMGLTGALKIAGFMLPAYESVTQHFDFYVGPKNHTRIAKLQQNQEQAMQFGFFAWISKMLLGLLNWLHGFVGNWGVAIILLTLIVRGALLPITLMSMKSMRKMSKIQEPMKKLKEKYPDDTQKQQQIMMELYKLNKINPVAGCLPMVAQIPIFFALFGVLRSAAELRFANFLWISDLSTPHTIFTLPNMPILGDFPVNALPFVWLVTLAYQMWTMPTPTVDNSQAKMMKFMPFIFFPFTYTFASGLVLYWSVSNVFTIGQQWLVRRGGDDFEVQLPPAFKKAMDGDSKKKRRRKK